MKPGRRYILSNDKDQIIELSFLRAKPHKPKENENISSFYQALSPRLASTLQMQQYDQTLNNPKVLLENGSTPL